MVDIKNNQLESIVIGCDWKMKFQVRGDEIFEQQANRDQ